MKPIIDYAEQTEEYGAMKEALQTWLQSKRPGSRFDENEMDIELDQCIAPKMQKLMKIINTNHHISFFGERAEPNENANAHGDEDRNNHDASNSTNPED